MANQNPQREKAFLKRPIKRCPLLISIKSLNFSGVQLVDEHSFKPAKKELVTAFSLSLLLWGHYDRNI